MIATRGAGITAAAGTGLTHHLFAKLFSLDKSLIYAIKHLESPYHTFVHCKVSVAAASLRTRASISVPFSGPRLSSPLLIKGLVSRYLTNSLISRRLIFRPYVSRKTHSSSNPLSNISFSFPKLSST